MGLRAQYGAIKNKLKEQYKAAQARLDNGSLREALGVFLEDPDGPHTDELAPAPVNGKCDNHPPRKNTKSFAGHLVDLLVVPALFAGWWKQIVLEPDYIFPGADSNPVLQHPKNYGLAAFEERPMVFYGTDEETGKKVPSRQVMAWYAPAKPGFPTFAYCHGNAGGLDARRFVLQELNDAGFGVMIAAYPGYKGSKEDFNGKKQEMTERNFVGAAKGMYAVLRSELAVRKMQDPATSTDIIMFGESMGSAVAMKAAREIEMGNRYKGVPRQDVAAVVCFAAFRSLPERVREEYPLMPASYLMGIHLDAESVVARIKAPVVLLHGTADEVTCHHHSLSLKKEGGDNVDVILIPGANHRLTKQKNPGRHPFSPVSETTEDPEMLKIDREQVRNLIAHVQTSLHEKGLCPAPKIPPTGVPGTGPEGKKNWENAVDVTRRKSLAI